MSYKTAQSFITGKINGLADAQSVLISAHWNDGLTDADPDAHVLSLHGTKAYVELRIERRYLMRCRRIYENRLRSVVEASVLALKEAESKSS